MITNKIRTLADEIWAVEQFVGRYDPECLDYSFLLSVYLMIQRVKRDVYALVPEAAEIEGIQLSKAAVETWTKP